MGMERHVGFRVSRLVSVSTLRRRLQKPNLNLVLLTLAFRVWDLWFKEFEGERGACMGQALCFGVGTAIKGCAPQGLAPTRL